MKYYYQLKDDRIIAWLEESQIDENEREEFLEIELDSRPEEITLGAHGISEGRIVYLGYTPEGQAILSRSNSRSEIERLKLLLSASDYKITKCYEAQILGNPLPYDVAAISAERQAWRDEINSLEEELAGL
jgi:hypothetical protein